MFSNASRDIFAGCKITVKKKTSLSEIRWLICMLRTVACLLLWLPSGRAQVFPMLTLSPSGTSLAPPNLAAPLEKPTSHDVHTTAARSRARSRLERAPALRHFSDWRRAEERLGEICFILWDTQALPVSSFFFQKEPALTLVTAGMSPDPRRTAIPRPGLQRLGSVKSCKHKTHVLGCAKRQCRSVTHHGHKPVAPQLPVATARGFLHPEGSTERRGKEAKVRWVPVTYTGGDTSTAQEVTPAVHKAPSPHPLREWTWGRLYLTPLAWLNVSHLGGSSGAGFRGWMHLLGWVHVFTGHISFHGTASHGR